MSKGFWPVINVDNVEKTVEFYKAIGLKAKLEDADMPGAEGMKYGVVGFGPNTGLMIWNKHNVPSDQPEDTKAWVSGDLGKGVVFSLSVPNVQKSWAGAQKLRAEIDSPLEKQPWGGHGFTVVDPDGYVLSITDKFPPMDTTPKKKMASKKTKTAPRNVKGKAKPKRKGR